MRFNLKTLYTNNTGHIIQSIINPITSTGRDHDALQRAELSTYLFPVFLRCRDIPRRWRRLLRFLFGKLRLVHLLANELVFLPVLFLVLLAAVKGAPAPTTLEEVLHFPTQFTVLLISFQIALLHVCGHNGCTAPLSPIFHTRPANR